MKLPLKIKLNLEFKSGRVKDRSPKITISLVKCSSEVSHLPLKEKCNSKKPSKLMLMGS